MRFAGSLVPIALAAIPLMGCGGGKAPGPAPSPNVMEVTAVDQTFQAPDSVLAGWVTFRFKNASDMTHFALVEKLPEGKKVADQQAEVAPVFQAGLDLLNAGKPDSAMAKFKELPAWFGEIEFLGGPGFLGPGRSEETTVHLDPGTYMLECYVKTVGVFHSYNPEPGQYGMVHQFEVFGSSKAPPPKADVQITISSDGGIRTEGDIGPGPHTIAVHFKDQKPHENFVGHDVHLVRLAPDTDLDALAAWMDWTQPTGLEVPAPAEFLGGVNEMPAGSTGYLTVDLDPGQYAWIAEVPKPREKGMLKTFTVLGKD
jgi:hypothetical protein